MKRFQQATSSGANQKIAQEWLKVWAGLTLERNNSWLSRAWAMYIP